MRLALFVCVALSSLSLLSSTAWAQPQRGARGALAGEPPGTSERVITRLLEGHTDRHEEAQILTLLRSASSAELDRLLRRLDLHQLLDGVDDHLCGPKHRDALLNLLAKRRLKDLSIPARSRLVDALQTGPTDAREESAIRDLLLGTQGADLTRLKNLIDRGTDHRDLRQLVFVDIDDAGLRREILDHIRREGQSSPGRGRVRVVSDIDDTLYSSWKDRRYPKGARYPGVLALQREINRGGHTAFLTARPSGRDGRPERGTHETLRKKGVERASVLSGDLTSLLGHGAMAKKKRANFDDYRRLFPEYGFVFAGDSGQGDARFAADILADDSKALSGAWIHDVTGMDAASRERLAKQGLTVFDTYVGAAQAAYQSKLIDQPGLARVARAAVQDYLAVRFDSVKQQTAARAQLKRDLDAVNALLPKAQRVRF